MGSFLNLIENLLNKIKPNLMLFVVLLFVLAKEIMGHIIANIGNPDANQLIVGALLGILEIWPETPILPKPLFSWRRLPM